MKCMIIRCVDCVHYINEYGYRLCNSKPGNPERVHPGYELLKLPCGNAEPKK